MSLLTQELLKKKLSSWTLNAKIPDLLGFTSSDANEIKLELESLVELGLVEKQGQRRGLKFRFKSGKSSKATSSNDDEQDSESDDTVDEEITLDTATKISHSASLRAFFADRDLVKQEATGKTPLQLMSVITDIQIKDPSILSHTLAYKRTSEGNIIVTFWSGCVKQYEKTYNLNAFIKVLTSELKALSKPLPANFEE